MATFPAGRNISPRRIQQILDGGGGTSTLVGADLGDWTLHNFAAGQTLTKVGAVLRWETDGTNATDTTFGAGVGAMAVLKVAIDTDLQVLAATRWAAFLGMTQPTAVDVGAGFGVVSADVDAPTNFMTRVHFLDAVAITIRDSGDVADSTRTTGSAFRDGRFWEQCGINNRAVAQYNLGSPTADDASVFNANAISSPFSTFSTGDALFFALFFKGGSNAGSVDIGPIRHDLFRASPL